MTDNIRNDLVSPPSEEHEDIWIEFELAGQMFEAVGFLAAGEEWVRGEEALRRVDNGHLLKSEEDWRVLYQNRHDLPVELKRYYLVTARPSHVDPRNVSILYPGGAGWDDFWDRLGGQWDRSAMVLRRRVS